MTELLDRIERDADGRPTFWARQNGRNLPIRAAGFTMFTRVDAEWHVLLMQTEKWLEDPGGKTDMGDRDITVTAAREVDEESNHAWCWWDLLHMALASDVYVSSGKYANFFVEVEHWFDPSIFGTIEAHDEHPREFCWVPVSALSRSRLNPRLDINWLTYLIDHLTKLDIADRLGNRDKK